jgi:hypothetical protein
MANVYPVDYTSDVGRVRKFIPDVTLLGDPANPFAEPDYIWSDEALQSFIDDELPVAWVSGAAAPRVTIWRAAAMAMIATANDVNLTLKKLVTEDLETDGPAVADKLIKAAHELLGKALIEENGAASEEIFLTVFPEPTTRHPEGTEWVNFWSTH